MFHLRFTPYDISGYTFDFLEKYEKYIIAKEEIDDNGNPLLHYHVLVETSYDVQSLRNDAKASLKIPKSGRGKNNKYYAILADWKDPGYICKYNDIQKSKGYSEKEVMEYVISGKQKYLDKVKATELSGEKAPAVLPPKKEKIVKVPFQQSVIADAAADWYNYKRNNPNELLITKKCELKQFVCNAMRKHGRGINQYLVKELAYAVLYDDLDYRDYVLKKIEL